MKKALYSFIQHLPGKPCSSTAGMDGINNLPAGLITRGKVLGFIFAAIFLMALATGGKAAQAATLVISPSSGSATVGNTITVNIVLDTQSQAAYGVDVYSLHFSPSVLQVSTVTPGSLLPVIAYNNIDNTNGVVQFSQISSTSGSNFTGSGNLATITFQAVAAGTSAVTIDFTAGSTNQSDVAGLYTNLLTSVTNGSFTVNPAADTTPPSTPTNVAATSTSASAVSVTWTASTDNVGVTGYQVYRCSGSSCTPTVQVATSSTASFADSGLTASTVYGYRIKAFDAALNLSGFSGIAYATTQANPPVISNIVVSSITQTSATITWTTNTNSDSQVDYGLTNAYGSSSVLNSTLTTSHSVSLSGLTAGTLYHYRVKSRDSFGNLTASTDNTFTTQSAPDTTAPTVSITNPSSSGQNVSGSITFSATASDPTVAGQVTSGLFSITLLVDGSVFATTSSGSVSVNLDTTTLTNATHTLTATAKDNAGNTATTPGVTIIVFNLGNATRYPRKLTLSSLEDLSAVPAGTQITATVISPTTQAVLSTLSISPDASSDYTVNFQNTFPQVVSIRVGVSGYLTQLLTSIDTTVNSGSVISVPELSAGDFNNDDTVNTLDYSLMNAHWLQNYPAADINRDNLVNSLDFAVLKNNWNKTGL